MFHFSSQPSPFPPLPCPRANAVGRLASLGSLVCTLARLAWKNLQVKKKVRTFVALIEKKYNMKKVELSLRLKNGQKEVKFVNVSTLEEAIVECRWILRNCPKVVFVSFNEFNSNYIIERQ